jgi:sec-independent protein translocase protein TatA
MNVFGIGLPEMAVIAAIALLVFGPKRLPELGRSLGRTLKGFQTASSEFEQEFRSALSTTDSGEPPAGQTAESAAAQPPSTLPSAAAPEGDHASPSASSPTEVKSPAQG